MGRNSGGNRGGGLKTKGISAYNRAVAKIEKGIRFNKFETGIIVDNKGKEISRVKGKKNKVEYTWKEIIKMKDNVVTHNHPSALGKKGILSIGNSFSRADVDLAINANVKEVRAVTPKYTFSLKRPKGGWNTSRYEMYAKYNEINRNVQKELISYIRANNFSKTAVDRATVLEHHLTIRGLAKYYGWDYSKHKG